MAKKTIEKFFSDISGEEIESGTPTLTFAFDGTTYEIDVTDKEKSEIEKAFAPYIRAGRKASGAGNTRRRTRRSSGSSNSGSQAKEVRAWAKEQGIEVPARGRIPAEVLEKYNAAN
ncbi:histone-like nucleoid-structuring protein Lsr2 [Aeromicrobium camelliae]|uniref:histone-like nucleoid-structuring protein Lsr2 n=1 Tax=Aeromicrobium camelliae TaxID=1538144 RepID=UPI001FB687BD|nr:Lsr2 family protein [Aeromicrobium camelliae]